MMADCETEDALADSFLAELPAEVVSELRAGGERADYPAGTTLKELLESTPTSRPSQSVTFVIAPSRPGAGQRPGLPGRTRTATNRPPSGESGGRRMRITGLSGCGRAHGLPSSHALRVGRNSAGQRCDHGRQLLAGVCGDRAGVR